jgi:hypothetical protein
MAELKLDLPPDLLEVLESLGRPAANDQGMRCAGTLPKGRDFFGQSRRTSGYEPA